MRRNTGDKKQWSTIYILGSERQDGHCGQPEEKNGGKLENNLKTLLWIQKTKVKTNQK